MASTTTAATTATRTTIDAMCSLTIDCRCDTCIDGITRYQWPRIIAVQAPPSSAADESTLASVIACTPTGRPAPSTAACATSATIAEARAVQTTAGRIDASVRPTVAQYRTTAASQTTSDASAAHAAG